MSDFKEPINIESGVLAGYTFTATPEETVATTAPVEEKHEEAAESEKSLETQQQEKKPEEKAATEKQKEKLPENKPEAEITPDRLNTFLNDASKGEVKSLEELSAKLAKYKELEQSQTPRFKSPKEEAVFNFLSKYQGEDYGQGLQLFAKLQALDVKSLDNMSAIKQAETIKNVQRGMSFDKAERLAEIAVQRRYDGFSEEDAQLQSESDSIDARTSLEAMQKETVTPKEDPQVQQAQKLQEQSRAKFLNEVDSLFKNTTTPEKFKFSDNPEEDLTFEESDPITTRKSIENYADWFQSRYIKDGNYNVALLKKDIQGIEKQEIRIKQAINHGIVLGKEQAIRERTNTPAPKDTKAPKAGSGIPKTFGDSISQAVVSTKN